MTDLDQPVAQVHVRDPSGGGAVDGGVCRGTFLFVAVVDGARTKPSPPLRRRVASWSKGAGTRQHKKGLVSGTIGAFRLRSDELPPPPPSQGGYAPLGGVGVVCGFTQPRPGQEQGPAIDVNRDAQSRSVARVGPGAGTGLNTRWRWCSGWGCVKGRPLVLGLWVGLRPNPHPQRTPPPPPRHHSDRQGHLALDSLVRDWLKTSPRAMGCAGTGVGLDGGCKGGGPSGYSRLVKRFEAQPPAVAKRLPAHAVGAE